MDLPAPSADDLLGLLAEEDRLRVVAAIVLGAGRPEDIADVTGRTPRTVARALARLVAGGLVEGGSGTAYRVRTEVLRNAAAQRKPEPAGAEGETAVLGRFVRDGKLVSIPSARSKRLLVLDLLAGQFEPGRRYTEAEVNQTLGAWHPDYAALRRYLVDEGFLRRDDERDPASGPPVPPTWVTRSSPGSSTTRSYSGSQRMAERRPHSGQDHTSTPESCVSSRTISWRGG
jgi:hypothetical protein